MQYKKQHTLNYNCAYLFWAREKKYNEICSRTQQQYEKAKNDNNNSRDNYVLISVIHLIYLVVVFKCKLKKNLTNM